MLNLVSLLAAVALVSMQCNLGVSAQLGQSSQDLDNSIPPNVVAPARRRLLRKFVLISQPPQESVQHVIGTSLELTCEALGSPTPSIHWLKNGEPIIEFSEQSNEIPPAVGTSLARIHSKLITMAETGDVFTCVASAGAKEASADSTVVGVEAGENIDAALAYQKLYSAQPHITSYYEDIYVESGSTVLLLCRVHSYGPRQVIWEKDNEVVYDNARVRTLPSGDLIISNLRWSDRGAYWCTAKNLYGKETVSTFLYPTKA